MGVDVFLVISGFLITGLLLREAEETGTISWGAFVARRVRRLLPAATTVLVTTALVAWVVVPGLRRRQVGLDIASAAGYVVNWRLADRAVDYLAYATHPSPVQHFWSLAVEEQFYLVWPLCLIAAIAVGRRLLRRQGARPARHSGHGPVVLVWAVLSATSFAWALWLGSTDPARAYLVTTTRVWELGVGCGLALLAARRPAPRFGPGTRRVLGWGGLAAVLAAAVAVPDDAAWPGPWTLLPTLGAGAVILAGTGAVGGDRPSTRVPTVGRLLGTRPATAVGALSYSLYLWHWPALVLTDWAVGGLSDAQRVAVVVASAVPAWAGHRLIEQPVRRGSLVVGPRRAVLAGVGLPGLVVAASLPALTVTSVFRPEPAAFRPGAVAEGARALSVTRSGPTAYQQDRWDWLVPDPEKAVTDRPAADVDHCQVDRQAASPVPCEFGNPHGAHTVALVGDSKAMQWLPAVRDAGGDRWRIVTYGKSSCAFAEATTELAGRPYRSCDAWNDAVMDRLRADPPDLVVTSSAARNGWTDGHGSRAAIVDGLASRWRELQALGVRVLVIGDNPASPDDLDVCAARHPHDLDACSFDGHAAVRRSALAVQEAARREAPRTRFLDLTSWICPHGRCPIAIGHVTVHRPGHHITATYAATLARVVDRRIARSLRSRPPLGSP